MSIVQMHHIPANPPAGTATAVPMVHTPTNTAATLVASTSAAAFAEAGAPALKDRTNGGANLITPPAPLPKQPAYMRPAPTSLLPLQLPPLLPDCLLQ